MMSLKRFYTTIYYIGHNESLELDLVTQEFKVIRNLGKYKVEKDKKFDNRITQY